MGWRLILLIIITDVQVNDDGVGFHNGTHTGPLRHPGVEMEGNETFSNSTGGYRRGGRNPATRVAVPFSDGDIVEVNLDMDKHSVQFKQVRVLIFYMYCLLYMLYIYMYVYVASIIHMSCYDLVLIG